MTTTTQARPQSSSEALEAVVQIDARAYAVSKAAAARILGVEVRDIKRVERWATVVMVVIVGRGAMFLSYRKFEADYHALRLQGSQSVSIECLSSPWDLDLLGWMLADRKYELTLRDAWGQPRCACKDHERAREQGRGHHLCKHLLAAQR